MKSVAVFALIAFLIMSSLAGLAVALPSDSAEVLDLYTQKEPYSGRGLNQSSDSFGPSDEVEIYSLATRNGAPVEGLLVAFQIFGPENSVENITFSRSSVTDVNGTSAISFRLSNFATNFGTWVVVGNTRIGDVVVSDTLSFEVGWLVQVTSIRTVNEDSAPKERFTRDSDLGLEIEMRSILMVEARVTVVITVCDSLGTGVAAEEIDGVAVEPNGVPTLNYYSLHIPRSAYLGEAEVYASAYTKRVDLGGVPYSPEESVAFLITSRDVAITKVQSSKTQAAKGEPINIEVQVGNKGWENETFEVKAYLNLTLIGTQTVLNLQSGSLRTMQFVLNTESIQEGIYVPSASASAVPGEIDLYNNVLSGGLFEIISAQPPHLIHDVSVLNVNTSALLVFVGDFVEFHVVVGNQGDFSESFEITVFANSMAIVTSRVESLDVGEERVLLLGWNSSNVGIGNYTISALAGSVPAEIDLQDNLYVNGILEVAESPRGWPAAELTYWFIALALLGILALALLAWLHRRRKKSEDSFYSGWSAWYYCHAIRN